MKKMFYIGLLSLIIPEFAHPTNSLFSSKNFESVFFYGDKLQFDCFMPTTIDELDRLHDKYVELGASERSSRLIWNNVQLSIYSNALDSVMLGDKLKIQRDVVRFSSFTKLVIDSDYDDGFLDILFPDNMLAKNSILWPFRCVYGRTTDKRVADKFNTTVDEINMNGGYLAMKLYDSVLKNYAIYDGLLDEYKYGLSLVGANTDYEESTKNILKFIMSMDTKN